MDKNPVVATITVNGAYITTSCEVMVREALKLAGKEPSCPVQGGPIHYIVPPKTTTSFDVDTEIMAPTENDIIEWDRLVIIEHDVLLPTDALIRIAHYSPEHAVVGTMVFEHAPPYPAMVFIEDEEGHIDPITPETVKDWCADPMLYRCDGTSFGCISIARHVLEDWDPSIPMFGMNHELGSHDLWFTREARRQGYNVYVDSGIVAQHLTSVPIGISQNQSNAHMVDPTSIREFSFSER